MPRQGLSAVHGGALTLFHMTNLPLFNSFTKVSGVLFLLLPDPPSSFRQVVMPPLLEAAQLKPDVVARL